MKTHISVIAAVLVMANFFAHKEIKINNGNTTINENNRLIKSTTLTDDNTIAASFSDMVFTLNLAETSNDYSNLAPVIPASADFTEFDPEMKADYSYLAPEVPHNATFEEDPGMNMQVYLKSLAPNTPSTADFGAASPEEIRYHNLAPSTPQEAPIEERL